MRHPDSSSAQVAEPFEGLRVLRRTNLFENYLRYFVAEPSEVVETVRHSSLMVKNKLITDIEQVLREKKPVILHCMLDGLKKLQGRVVTWNRFASSVSIT
jgi:hypothetical protein